MAKSKTLELSIQIAGKVDRSFLHAIGQAQAQAGSLMRSVGAIGTAGMAAMASLAAGAAATIARCSKEAEAYEAALSDVTKYVDGIADEGGNISDAIADNGKSYAQNYAEMSKALLDLSTQIPMTAEELSVLAAAAGQSGKSIADLLQYGEGGKITGFLVDTGKIATAMDISPEIAGEWAAKWEVAFNKSHDEIMVLMDQINHLGGNSATTSAEIARVVNDSAALGNIANVDVATTAALADAFLATGGEEGKAATSIKRIYTNIMKGSSATKAQKMAWNEIGLTAEGVAQAMAAPDSNTSQILEDIFRRIQGVDKSRQTAVISTLFGQWAIGDAAKVVNNLDVFRDALRMVQDVEAFTGSMDREYIIKSNTADAVGMMSDNAKKALRIEMGTAFLPVKKSFALMTTDLVNHIRGNMPEITELAEKIASRMEAGAERFGKSLEGALPYLKKALGYLNENGDQALKMFGGLAAIFAGMQFAPMAEWAFKEATSLVIGDRQGNPGKRGVQGGMLGSGMALYAGGKHTAGKAWDAWQSAMLGARLANSEPDGGKARGTKALGNAAIGAIWGFKDRKKLTKGTGKALSKNVLETAGKIAASKEQGGILGMAKRAAANTRIGRYVGGIAGAANSMGKTAIGNTIMQGARMAKGAGWEIITGILGDGNEMKPGMGLNHVWPSMKMMGHAAREKARGSKIGAAISGNVLPKAKGTAGIIGRSIGNLSQVAGAGAGIIGKVWSPAAVGFGGMFAGALPILGGISATIAAVSILGDNLEGIRETINKVFGEKGTRAFDWFAGKAKEAGGSVAGLFQQGGVEKALSRPREKFGETLEGGGILSTIMGGKDAGLAAFDGGVQILQAIMSTAGQLVTFSTGTVKPIMLEGYQFVTGTALPGLVDTFAKSAPYIASITGNMGTAIMRGMELGGDALQAILPIAEQAIQIVLTVGGVAIPSLLSGAETVSQGIADIVGHIGTILSGMNMFISGAFSGDWQKAWDGVIQIFDGTFSALAGLCKTPINAAVNIINGVIGKINGMNIKIPDWVPAIGGKEFAVKLPTLPTFAKGGFTSGASIAGEAGTEAVISFQRHVRSRNIGIWMRAGEMLGLGNSSRAGNTTEKILAPIKFMESLLGNQIKLKEIGTGGTNERESLTFAPQIIIQGNADQQAMEELIEKLRELFELWYDQKERKDRRIAY